MSARLRAHAPKVVSGLAIAAVAGVAGVISYTHIFELTAALHQPVMVARLMPFSVDGLIVVGSVVLLTDSGQPRLGWLGVGPGVVISLFANVESGIRYGVLAAIWAGIPAVAFSLATFMLERWLKAQASRPDVFQLPVTSRPAGGDLKHPGETPDATGETVSEPVPAAPAAYLNGSGLHPDEVQPFAEDLARGDVPSLRRIRTELHVGQPRAQEIQARLAALARTP